MSTEVFKISFLVDRLSYPPHEGVQEQYLKLFKEFEAIGGQIELFGSVRQCDQCNWEELEKKYPNVKVIATAPEAPNFYTQFLINLYRSLRFNTYQNYFEKTFGSFPSLRDPLFVSGPAFLPLLGHFSTVKMIYSPVDAYSLRFKRFSERAHNPANRVINRIKHGILSRFEVLNLPKANAVQVVSEVDAEYLRSLCKGSENIFSIPLVFDLPPKKEVIESVYDIVISGNLAYDYIYEGIEEFIVDCMPAILASRPEAKLLIHCSNPTLLENFRTKHQHDSIEYISWLDDYSKMLQTGRVVVFPDKSGTGIKNRIFFAAAVNRPIVGTTWIFEGTPLRDGEDCIIRNDAIEISQSILSLLTDTATAEEMASNARRTLDAEFGPESVRSRWKELIHFATSTQTTESPST